MLKLIMIHLPNNIYLKKCIICLEFLKVKLNSKHYFNTINNSKHSIMLYQTDVS